MRWAVLGALVAACQSTPRPVDQAAAVLAMPVRAPRGNLALHCAPGDAAVSLDGVELGSCRDFLDRPLNLRRGMHRLEVKKPGHLPYVSYYEPSEATAALNVTLTPAGPAEGEAR